MIDKQQLEKFTITYSVERLSSYMYTKEDSIQDIISHYKDNIMISQSLYPELCTLEIILRNAINNLLMKNISPNWIENEIKNNIFLEAYDYQTLVKTYKDTQN